MSIFSTRCRCHSKYLMKLLFILILSFLPLLTYTTLLKKSLTSILIKRLRGIDTKSVCQTWLIWSIHFTIFISPQKPTGKFFFIWLIQLNILRYLVDSELYSILNILYASICYYQLVKYYIHSSVWVDHGIVYRCVVYKSGQISFISPG